MLGLQFYVCDRCDAVHSGVEEPPACARCGDGRFANITTAVQGDSYFTRASAPER
ncbi:hypothetical protein [Halobaculum marinum]|uniref:Rubrerythrin-like domain-containing protein n=1 Tax=Halobaculum marinum TaxID=3031996 RepID=A0ABD5WU88_9EURY|nr:hypothetical protein [Halobaculum sp. DT55]